MLSDREIHMLCKRKDKMKAQRGTFETHWQDIANFFDPNKADYNVKRSKGDKRTTLVYDSTGIQSNEMLAAGLHGFLTNPSSEWFSMRIKDDYEKVGEQPEVKQWLEDTTQVMIAELSAPEVAFSSHIHEWYLSLCSIGTAALFIGEPSTRDGLSFKAIHIDEIFIAENADGLVDTVFRCFKQTLRQIVQRWGEEALSPRMKRVWEKKEYDKEFDIMHCVYPREEYDSSKVTADEMPIASLYIDEKEKHVLHESGYPEMPFMVGRWSKSVGEVFGRSPAMTALPDVKMLQEMMKTTIKAAQKIVDPPLLVPDDGVLGPVRTIPGGLNYYRASSGARIEPLITGGRPDISEDMMEGVRNRVRMTFYLDQLQFQNGPQMTATEVMERTERTLRLLGPTLGRLQSEFLGPMIERIFGVLARADRIPPAPEIVMEQQLKIEYVSPLARAQKQAETQGIMRTIETAAVVAQVDQDAAKVIKGTEAVRHMAELNGVPPKILASEDEINEEKQAEMQMMQQQMMMQTMQQGADIAKTANDAGLINEAAE